MTCRHDATYVEGCGSRCHGAREGDHRQSLRADLPCATRSALFASFFFCLMVNYVAIQLVPSMLRDNGKFDTTQRQPAACDGSNYRWCHRAPSSGRWSSSVSGSRVTMLGMSAAAVVCSLCMAGMRLDPTTRSHSWRCFFITGGLLNAVQTTMYALAAHVYPDRDSQHRGWFCRRVRTHRKRACRLRWRLRP